VGIRNLFTNFGCRSNFPVPHSSRVLATAVTPKEKIKKNRNGCVVGCHGRLHTQF